MSEPATRPRTQPHTYTYENTHAHIPLYARITYNHAVAHGVTHT